MRLHPVLLPVLLSPLPLHAQWQWTQALQSSTPDGYEYGHACAVAPDNALLVAGLWRNTARFGDIAFSDVDDPSVMHGSVVRYDPSGTVAWAHDLATTDASALAHIDVDVDGAGNVFVGGDFRDSLLVDGMAMTGLGGEPDRRLYFVIKFTAAGHFLWGASVDIPPATGEFNALDVDAVGDVWVVGHDGGQQGHILKLSGGDGGILVHHTTTGASSYVNDVKTDAAGNAYVLGFANNDFTIAGVTCPHNMDLGPSTSQWIGKFDAGGTPVWFHVPSQGGSGFTPYPEGNIAVTPDGTVFSDARKLMRFGDDTISTGSPGLRGIYALDTDGQVLFARRANTTSGLYFLEAIGTADGEAIFLGHFNGMATVDLVDTTITVEPAGNSLLLVRYDATGATTGVKAGPHITEACGIGLDLDGDPVVCGSFSLTPSFDGLALDGDQDLFALRSDRATTGWNAHDRIPGPMACPNPASDAVRLSGFLPGPVPLDVVDELGRCLLHTDRFDPSSDVLRLDPFPPGVLLLRVATGTERTMLRVVHRP